MALEVTWTLLLGLLGFGHVYLTLTYTGRDLKRKDHLTVPPLLCYFNLDDSWPDNGTLHPALNSTLCSHLIFISSGISDCQIAPYSPGDVTRYFAKIPLLRKQNPDLKILLSNGGGDNHGFSPVLGSAENRTKFVNSALPFLKKYDFDGLDVDWEFPGWQLPIGQRANFTLLLKDMRAAFDVELAQTGRKYTLSAAVAAGRSVMVIYDVPALAMSLDFINLMCYDYHGYASYDPITGYNSPLYPTDWDKQIVITSGNVGWSSYEWYKRGMPKEQIMVGIPTYTHTWTLEDPRYHEHNAPATGPGKECNECSFAWVCDFLSRPGTTRVVDQDAAVPYMYNGDQWVSYDDVDSLILKTEWILSNGFAGVMVYSLNADDYSGACRKGRFPLLNAIKATMNRTKTVHTLLRS